MVLPLPAHVNFDVPIVSIQNRPERFRDATDSPSGESAGTSKPARQRKTLGPACLRGSEHHSPDGRSQSLLPPEAGKPMGAPARRPRYPNPRIATVAYDPIPSNRTCGRTYIRHVTCMRIVVSCRHVNQTPGLRRWFRRLPNAGFSRISPRTYAALWLCDNMPRHRENRTRSGNSPIICRAPQPPRWAKTRPHRYTAPIPRANERHVRSHARMVTSRHMTPRHRPRVWR